MPGCMASKLSLKRSLGRKGSLRDVEPDQGDGQTGSNHGTGGQRIRVEVEFRGRRDIAPAVAGTAHHDELANPGHRLLVPIERRRDVGEGPKGDNGEVVAIPPSQFDHRIGSMSASGGQMPDGVAAGDSAQAIATMHVLGSGDARAEGVFATLEDDRQRFWLQDL